MGNVQLWLVRHGETEWSLSGAHTSHTDISLTEEGRKQARSLVDRLQHRTFSLVLTSPMQRARETCNIAGYGNKAQVEEALLEWDYGIYEGRTTFEIRNQHPGWSVWKDGTPDGESLEQVEHRARAVIDRCVAAGGQSLLFAHAHILRVMAACWLDLPAQAGQLFVLSAGSLSKLGYERETRALLGWNQAS
ncbi:MAG: histidine phosphatase family protein [Pseudomonadota bacterium]|nr:histidine phosphatase family protein [Pseudomonadota bacterium]